MAATLCERRLRSVLAHLHGRRSERNDAVTCERTAAGDGGGESLSAPLLLRPPTEALRATDVVCGAAHIQSHAVLQDEANAMVKRCLELGIEDYDTAPGYGDSEQALGAALRANGAGARVCRVHTKIAGTEPRFPTPDWSAAAAELSYAKSLALLGPITTIRAHGLRHADRPSANSPRLRDWCEPLDQALLPGLGPSGGLLAGLRDLRSRGLIQAVSLGMDTGNATPDKRDVRAMGIIDFMREAPEGTFDSALIAYGWNLDNQVRRAKLSSRFSILFWKENEHSFRQARVNVRNTEHERHFAPSMDRVRCQFLWSARIAGLRSTSPVLCTLRAMAISLTPRTRHRRCKSECRAGRA
jgi:hypothetical protein